MNISKFVLAVLAPSLPPALAAPTALRGPDPARDEEAGALPAAPAGDRPTPVLPALAAPSLRQQDLDQDAGATAPRGGGRRHLYTTPQEARGARTPIRDYMCDLDYHTPEGAGFFCGRCQAENGYGYDVITYTEVKKPLECLDKCPRPIEFVGYEFAYNLHARPFCACRYEPGYVRTSKTAGVNGCPAGAGSFLGGYPCRANPNPSSSGVGPVTRGSATSENNDNRFACYPKHGWCGRARLQDNEYCGHCRDSDDLRYAFILFVDVPDHGACLSRCPESNLVGSEYHAGDQQCWCRYVAFGDLNDCPAGASCGGTTSQAWGPVVSGDGDTNVVCRAAGN